MSAFPLLYFRLITYSFLKKQKYKAAKTGLFLEIIADASQDTVIHDPLHEVQPGTINQNLITYVAVLGRN